MFISWWIIKERLLIVVEENLESKNDAPPRKLLEEIRDRSFTSTRIDFLFSSVMVYSLAQKKKSIKVTHWENHHLGYLVYYWCRGVKASLVQEKMVHFSLPPQFYLLLWGVNRQWSNL